MSYPLLVVSPYACCHESPVSCPADHLWATISTSGTAEVRVGRGKGQGKPEAKVHPYA